MSAKKDVPPGRPIDDQIVEMVRDWTFAVFGVSDGPKARRILGMLRYAASERQAALKEAGCMPTEAALALAARVLEYAVPKFRVGQAWRNDRGDHIVVERVEDGKVYCRRSTDHKIVQATEEVLEQQLSSGWASAPDTGGV
jgi:hypothetical protein